MCLNDENNFSFFNERNEENEFSISNILDNQLSIMNDEPLDYYTINELRLMTTQQTTKTSNTKRGRKRESNSLNPIHTKNNIDNIRRKVRIHAITFGMKLINDCIKSQYPNSNLVLKGISREITSDISIYFTLIL